MKLSGLGKKIESSCRKALYDFDMIDESGKVAVALSGGKDSLTTLMMLKRILGKGFPDADLFALHVSGEYTCGAGINQEALKRFCDRLEVPLVVKESTQTLDDLECYRCSRERRTLLFDAAKDIGAHLIAFGHHRDDNAQTLIMNMLQKGEVAGMLPKLKMHRYGVTIIRPLIYTAEEDVRQFARQSGFARVTCQCPVGQNSKRKQVDRLMDDMEEIFPHARHNLSQACLHYGSNKASFSVSSKLMKPGNREKSPGLSP